MSIYIHINQQTTGPYEENVVLSWLWAGQISPDVMACPKGATEWQPLKILFPVPAQFAASTNAQPSGLAPDRQAIVNWARQCFPVPVAVNYKATAEFNLGRKIHVKTLDPGGIETVGGMRHAWEALYYVSYRKERGAVRSPLGALVHAALTAGVESLSVKFTFQTGEALIIPFINNQKEILPRLETIPVERRTF